MASHEDHLFQLFQPRLDHQSGEQILHVVEMSWVKSLALLGLSGLFWMLRSAAMRTGFAIVTSHRLLLVDDYTNVFLTLDWADTTFAGSSQLLGVKEWRFTNRGQTYRLRAGKSPKKITKDRQAQFVDGFAPWVQQTLPQHTGRAPLPPPAARTDVGFAASAPKPAAPAKPKGPFPTFLVAALALLPLLAWCLWVGYLRLGNLSWDNAEVARAESQLAKAKKADKKSSLVDTYEKELETVRERQSSHLTEGIVWSVVGVVTGGAFVTLLVLHKKRKKRAESAPIPSGTAPAT